MPRSEAYDYEASLGMHSEPCVDPDAAHDRDQQADVDAYAERFQRLGRIDALTQVLNELRAYGYPVEFQRFVAAKLAKESGLEFVS